MLSTNDFNTLKEKSTNNRFGFLHSEGILNALQQEEALFSTGLSVLKDSYGIKEALLSYIPADVRGSSTIEIPKEYEKALERYTLSYMDNEDGEKLIIPVAYDNDIQKFVPLHKIADDLEGVKFTVIIPLSNGEDYGSTEIGVIHADIWNDWGIPYKELEKTIPLVDMER